MGTLTHLNGTRRAAYRVRADAPRYRVYTERNFDQISQVKRLPKDRRFAMQVAARVLPFRVNEYVLDELIDWDNVPRDPVFQITFPQPEMLAPERFARVAELVRSNAPGSVVREEIGRIHRDMNPHPAGQQTLNVPTLNGVTLEGMQHKYRETVLFFPTHGQTCHAYCSFCFRWPQFVGDRELRICAKEADYLQAYLRTHRAVTDLLITGGDPLVMKAAHLSAYLEPLMAPEFEHVQTIRIGTKALSYWPYRFVTDSDAEALLGLFERLVRSGKHVALMAHYDHWREMQTPIAEQAIRRVQETGAVIRTQGPLLAHVNDAPGIWAEMWRNQVKLGMVPYYMFVQRNTGPRRYFEVPLVRCWEIFRDAYKQVSGLARSVRGPSMSTGPGKVEVQGVTDVYGEQVFVLRFLQGRRPEWTGRPFFARFDDRATWLDQLRPALGQEQFFFEPEYSAMGQGVAE